MPRYRLSWQAIHISTVFPGKCLVTTSNYAVAILFDILSNLLVTNQHGTWCYILWDTIGTFRQTLNSNSNMLANTQGRICSKN